MPNQVNIVSLSGTPPFNIYVCDATITYCYFVQTIVGAPYIFNVPSPLDSTTPIILKVIDFNNCENIYLLNCQEIYGKEFEDFHIFLFQDASFTPSYSTSGNTCYDLSYNSLSTTLVNGPTFDSANGGSLLKVLGVENILKFNGPQINIPFYDMTQHPFMDLKFLLLL